MKDYISSIMIKNQFRLRWEFQMLSRRYSLDAIFDTGCSNTMISYNLLVNKKEIEQTFRKYIKKQALIKGDAKLNSGRGVESQSLQDKQQGSSMLYTINKYNVKGVKSLTDDEIKRLLDYKNLRFVYKASDMRIAGCKCENHDITISYDYDNVALIGMEIIKDFHTIICTKAGRTLLFAKFKYIDGLKQIFEEANKVLDSLPDDDEYIDFLDIQDKFTDSKTKKKTLTKEDFQANYVNSLIKKEN
jgi:hypothetical protein